MESFKAASVLVHTFQPADRGGGRRTGGVSQEVYGSDVEV